MKSIKFVLALSVLLSADASAQSYEPGQLYVTFNPGAVQLYVDSTGHTCCGIAYIDSINRANNFSAFLSAGCPPCSLMQNDFLIIFPPSVNIPALASAYKLNSNVKWAGPNYLFQSAFTPNDPFFTRPSPSAPPSSYQWALDSNHLQMQKAWDITKGDTNVVIGILEQFPGLGWRHPDLEPTVWINPGEDINHNGRFDSLDLNGADDNGDGYVDNVIGQRFRQSDGSPLCEPDPEPVLSGITPANVCNGLHGTWVWSNVVAATNNSTGIAGIGFKCRVMPTAFAYNSTSFANALCFYVEMRKKHGVPHILNMSTHLFSGDAAPTLRDSLLLNALDSMGVVLVSAAGNFSSEEALYPARHPKVISVAATDSNDFRTGFSDFHSTVDLSAPGFGYVATHDFDPVTKRPNNYRYTALDSVCDPSPGKPISGTSFSAPQVSGIAALIKSAYPNFTNKEIEAKLKSSTDSIRCCPSMQYTTQQESSFIAGGKLGTGRVNAFKAVTFFDTIPKSVAETTLTGTVYISGDLFIPAGKKVTLSPGTVLKFYPGDIFNKGVSGGLGEVIVKGTLVALGTATDSIKFISYKSTPGEQDWHSVRVLAGGSFKAAFCQFKNSYAGIDYQNSAADTVENCLFESNFMYGVYAKNGNLKILDNTFKNIAPGYGVYLNTANAVVSGNKLVNVTCGINSNQSFGTVSNNIITTTGSVPKEFGFRQQGASGSQFADFSGDSIAGKFHIAGVVADGAVHVTGGKIWMYATDVFISDEIEMVGILSSGVGQSQVRSSTLKMNDSLAGIAAVKVVGTPVLDLQGTAATGSCCSNGNRIFRAAGSPAVVNQTATAVPAQYNWWGGTPNGSFFSGTVTFDPYLTCSPTPPPCPPKTKVELTALPTEFSLNQNYPNPFNPRTSISFSLPLPGYVEMAVYNLLGQRVKVLIQSEKPAGIHSVEWDGTDKNGAPVSSGIYFYKMEAADYRQIKRMVFLK